MPRNVTSEGVGDDKLFDINTIGGKYTVNSEHFLCLKEDLCLSNIETYRELSVTMYHTIIYSFKTFKYDRLNFQSLIGAEQHIESQISDNIVEITFYDYLKLPTQVSKCLFGYKVGIEINNCGCISKLYNPYLQLTQEYSHLALKNMSICIWIQ